MTHTGKLKAQGQDESDHQFDKGIAVVKQLQVLDFFSKIDGDSPVFTGRAMFRMGHPQIRWSVSLMTQDEGNPAQIQGNHADVRALPLKSVECAISRRQLDTLMKHYGEEAGIPASKRHFHVLKHSIATHLLDARADLRFVQDWVGHASIKNTVIYAQLTSRGRDEEARKVFTSPYVVQVNALLYSRIRWAVTPRPG